MNNSFHNGTLPINLGWRGLWQNITLIGGPYANFPGDGFFGVCLREYIPQGVDADVHLPINDFSVPDDKDDVILAIKEVVAAAMRGDLVYVGCMGGWGRTGLFLSLVAKATGVDNPVSYVRGMYTPKAVETHEQQEYVDDFDVSWFEPWLMRQTWNRVRGREIETEV